MASIGRIHYRCTGIIQHVKNSSALTGTIGNESAPASIVRSSLSNPNLTTNKIIHPFSTSARASANVNVNGNEMNAPLDHASSGNHKFEQEVFCKCPNNCIVEHPDQGVKVLGNQPKYEKNPKANKKWLEVFRRILI